MAIDTFTFKNTRAGLLDSDDDGRVALGMFVFNDDNELL